MRVFQVLLLSGMCLGGLGCDADDPIKSPDESPPAQTEKSPVPAEPQKNQTVADANAQNASPANGESAPDNRTVSDDPKAQLQSDLDDAIALLEKGQVAAFMERYMPLEYLDEIREFSTVEQMAQNVKVGGAFEEKWLGNLRALKNAEVEFQDEENSKAQLEVDVSPKDADRPQFTLTNPAEEKIPASEGFSGELPDALGKAVEALEAGDHRKFVENMFPPSELSIATSDEGRETMAQRLKEHPQMVETMVADLKMLQKLTPEYNAEKTLATFRLNPDTKQARTVRFEKAGGWRMADGSKKIREDVYKQSQQPPIGIKKTLTTEWIRIREHWRLNQLP